MISASRRAPAALLYANLAEHLSDVWYPSSDDLDIFDASFDWILSVSHFGAITLARL